MAQSLPKPPHGQCFHCLQPLPSDGGYPVNLAGNQYQVCCYGCQAVAETINTQNLLHFYQYRDTSNALQVPLVPEELQQLEAYDDEQLQQQFTRQQDGARSISLSIEGMTCAACAWLIEQHTRRLTGVVQVNVNATTERVQVQWRPSQVQLSTILKTIAELGYRALPFQSATQEQEFKKRRRYFITRLGIAGLATMQVMMLAIGLYFGVVSDLEPELRQFMWWISLFMATPVLLYSAQPFYISAIRSIQAGRPNMDVPVTVALLSAYGASAYATVINEGEVYFESVAMFTFFLLVGRYFELLARQKAVSAAANLVKLIPAVAHLELNTGTVQSIPVSKLQPGNIIQVRPGATIPADGELLSEYTAVNESILTGESRLVEKHQNELVLAGSLNKTQPIRVRVTATQQQTVLASIIELQDLALSRKPKLARVAERMASKFVIRILMLAAATFLIWTVIEPSEAFWVTLSVLVATCPCALALAAPTAVTGAIHKLNKSGVLLRNADVLQVLPEVKTIFVDKTGTLTTGEFVLQQAHYYQTNIQDKIDAVTQTLEAASSHPLAAALQHLTKHSEPVTHIAAEPGMGLSGQWHYADGHTCSVRLGSLRYIQQWHPSFQAHLTEAQVFFATNDQVLAEYAVGDALRVGAKETIVQLQQTGLEVVMLTGDKLEFAQRVADQLGITELHANCLPADKLAILSAAQKHHPVAMVGDGLNDGPVLAQADVSITFGHAADLARTAADVILLRNQFTALSQLGEITQLARRILRQNIAWALAYNIGILPIAMAGFVTPYIAAIGMSASSLIVLLNSLRLYR